MLACAGFGEHKHAPGAFLRVALARRSPLGTSPPVMSIEPMRAVHRGLVAARESKVKIWCEGRREKGENRE